MKKQTSKTKKSDTNPRLSVRDVGGELRETFARIGARVEVGGDMAAGVRYAARLADNSTSATDFVKCETCGAQLVSDVLSDTGDPSLDFGPVYCPVCEVRKLRAYVFELEHMGVKGIGRKITLSDKLNDILTEAGILVVSIEAIGINCYFVTVKNEDAEKTATLLGQDGDEVEVSNYGGDNSLVELYLKSAQELAG